MLKKILNKKGVIIIVGPTGIGKTSLSIELAKKHKCEIISSDSRQFYKYMDIGTAKPTAEEMEQVVHHFIDIKFPNEYYNAGTYSDDARKVIKELHDKKIVPIIVGGSGLYIKALTDGFDEVKVSNDNVKQELRKQLNEKGLDYLYEFLKEIDPKIAQKLHPNDSQRILRAIEVWEVSGKPLSSYQKKKFNQADFQPLFVGLTMDRKTLYERIDKRVDIMIKQGFIEEVQNILDKGYSKDLAGLRTVGYQEIIEYLNSKLQYDEMIGVIKQKTRKYAKRQITWFKKESRINWFNLDDNDNIIKEIELRMEK